MQMSGAIFSLFPTEKSCLTNIKTFITLPSSQLFSVINPVVNTNVGLGVSRSHGGKELQRLGRGPGAGVLPGAAAAEAGGAAWDPGGGGARGARGARRGGPRERLS